jgi:hypothetical protein
MDLVSPSSGVEMERAARRLRRLQPFEFGDICMDCRGALGVGRCNGRRH